jgi:transcriptional regulator with XRE-family HTH domain
MNNLKYYRKLHNKTQKDVADYLGIVQQAYGHYETGRRQIPLENLLKLAEYYQVTINDLIGMNSVEKFEKPIQEQPEVEFEEEIYLPIVASLRCGYGQAGEPYIYIGKHGVPKSWAKRYGKDIVLNYALGDSMIPTILPGELMVCYPGEWWDDGTVAVITVNDTETVKRIYHAADGGIDLIPENPKYKIMHYTPQEIEEYHIHVLGHVVTTIPQEIAPIPRRE